MFAERGIIPAVFRKFGSGPSRRKVRRCAPVVGVLEDRALLSMAPVAGPEHMLVDGSPRPAAVETRNVVERPGIMASSAKVKYPGGGVVTTKHGVTTVKFPGGFVFTIPGRTQVKFPGGHVNTHPGGTTVTFPGGYVISNAGVTTIKYPGGTISF